MPYFENIGRHIQTDDSIMAGVGGGDHVTLFVASYVPRKVFISQPGPVSSALQSLQAHVELLFPVSLCPPVTPPNPKTKRNHSEFLESTILSCLWALAHADAIPLPRPPTQLPLVPRTQTTAPFYAAPCPPVPGPHSQDLLETEVSRAGPGQITLRTQGSIRECL